MDNTIFKSVMDLLNAVNDSEDGDDEEPIITDEETIDALIKLTSSICFFAGKDYEYTSAKMLKFYIAQGSFLK